MTKTKGEIIQEFYYNSCDHTRRADIEEIFDAALKYVREKLVGLDEYYIKVSSFKQICEIKDDNETTTED